MTQPRKKPILRLIAVIAAAVLLVAAVLFFPLTGGAKPRVTIEHIVVEKTET